ncbi:MAG: hypothetical protein ACH350_02355 [Parachlamydiaceae bacterium]
MKILNKALIFFSFLSLSLSQLEAKSVDFFLDKTVKETIYLKDDIPNIEDNNNTERSKFFSDYFQQLKIENVGNSPIHHFFPYTGQSPHFSLKNLRKKLEEKRYPLLTLLNLWKRSIICDQSLSSQVCHPLDLLNFNGACDPAVFKQQFISLCHALGIEIRLPYVQGQEVFDFGLDDEWNFLDFANNQIYLQLDNENLAPSESVLDDPFLALRTKHSSQAKEFNFTESWKKLATFEMIEQTYPKSVEYEQTKKNSNRVNGVDLFPGETLTFKTASNASYLSEHQCLIEQNINLEARKVNDEWKHQSLFPIYRLINNSSESLYIMDQKAEVKPGESFDFATPQFEVSFTFSRQPAGRIVFSGAVAWHLFPAITKGTNTIHLGAKHNQTRLHFQYEMSDEMNKNKIRPPLILNENHAFDHCLTRFNLDAGEAEKIWWQIGWDSQFEFIPSNFDQIEEQISFVALPLISETFLNSDTPYYFRVKSYQHGQWSDWSSTFPFRVLKPAPVDGVIFQEAPDDLFELNWERYAEESDDLEYLVFGSNSFDFIPSIYSDKQINEMVGDEVTDWETQNNLVAITKKPKLIIPGHFAYYRIIAKQGDQLSVPSRIIRIYDHDLIQPRNILQRLKGETQFFAKRRLIPGAYPWSNDFLPKISASAKFTGAVVNLQSLLRSAKKGEKKYTYQKPDISDEIWAEVRDYLMPENHPAWPKLNRIFCKSRATQSTEHFKRAGFRRYRPGTWSRVSASSHPYAPDYFIKAYCDTEVGILYDWRKWIHRIKGAEVVRSCIKEHKLEKDFKVPYKCLYALPKHPSPPNNSKYVRHNFVLVCENMQILEHSENEKMYKYHLTAKRMKGIYTILQVCGLYDSTYVFNIPFCKDGKIAIIDTEYFCKWSVPFDKLTKYFPEELQSAWKRLTYLGGPIPDGKSIYNPPRMDRRDLPEKKFSKEKIIEKKQKRSIKKESQSKTAHLSS